MQADDEQPSPRIEGAGQDDHSSSGEESVSGQGGGGDDSVPSGKSLLSKADLEANFSYSLNEAAVRLGVSRTTLKRACR